MRSYSLFIIILLCCLILVIDIVAFYGLQSITHWIKPYYLKKIIDVLFWTFTVGLILGILILKIRMDRIDLYRRQSLVASLYGLTVSSFIPKLIFVIVISILTWSEYLFTEGQSKVIIPLVGLSSGFIPFFVILFGITRTIYHFKIHHQKITSALLPKEFEGFRIIHISDFHLGSFNYKFSIVERAIRLINEQDPDAILFTGDLVNNYAWELKGWAEVLQSLSSRSIKYAVLGNHDYGDYSQWDSPEEKLANFQSIKDFFTQIDFHLLLNESAVIQKDQAQIAVIGVENWGKPPFHPYGDLNKAMLSVRLIPFKILLSHDPSRWSEEVVSETDIALTLSGHTHGMQLGIGYGKYTWSPIQLKYPQWAGYYEFAGQSLYVNRGLGWLGFPGRLGMRPEITCLTLHRKSNTQE